uniref:Putative transcriptional repressor nf-x1-like protein n=1 Tax=Panstrongylus lignarius TaxID=156445 RepID=A0A224XLL9_9HEMI
MWSLLLKLGLTAVAGIGLGIVIILQQEAYRRESEYDRPRREPDPENGPSRRNTVRIRRNTPKSQQEEENQRELLETLLNSDSAECVICTDNISYQNKVWSCPHCWNIFHLDCISMWAEMNDSRSIWSCPVCRKDICSNGQTLLYKCMCGRETEPKVIDGVTPHCCGKPCIRDCGKQCHPGPC